MKGRSLLDQTFSEEKHRQDSQRTAKERILVEHQCRMKGRDSLEKAISRERILQEHQSRGRVLLWGPAFLFVLTATAATALAVVMLGPTSAPAAATQSSRLRNLLSKDQNSDKEATSQGPDVAKAGALPDQGALLRIHGRGAHRCTVGTLCSFTITVAKEASWKVTGKKPFEWDFMVTLRGPALVHVHVAQSKATKVPGRDGIWPGTTFLATYRGWDAGAYVAQVVNPCHTLGASGSFSTRKELMQGLSILAEWNLTITDAEYAHHGTEEGVKNLDTENVRDAGSLVSRLLVPSSIAMKHNSDRFSGGHRYVYSPCTETLGARWRLNASTGEYMWQPFPCATWRDLDSIFPGLLAKGVREIAFVGDSHLRFLMLHSSFLLTGEVPGELLKAHADFSIDISTTAPQQQQQQQKQKQPAERATAQNSDSPTSEAVGASGNSLRRSEKEEARELRNGSSDAVIRLSFYWVDGVYKNGEFGCRRRGQWSKRENSFPKLLGEPDVVVLNSATWSALSCQQPALAYPTHLNGFLSAMAGQIRALNCSRAFVFGAPPSPTCQPQADYRATNSLLRFQSDFSAVESAHYGMQFFDTWEIAAPRFERSCSPANAHYSCPSLPAGAAQGALTGEVGEAIALTFLQQLSMSFDNDLNR